MVRMRTIRNRSHGMTGYPLTAQRRLLLELIRNAGGHIDAKELYRRATSADRSVSLATVYRSLRLFRELGLVDEGRLGRSSHYYEMRRPAGHQHFICRDCGRVIEFHTPLMGDLLGNIQQEQGFSVTKAEFYLEGHCPQCREDMGEGA